MRWGEKPPSPITLTYRRFVADAAGPPAPHQQRQPPQPLRWSFPPAKWSQWKHLAPIQMFPLPSESRGRTVGSGVEETAVEHEADPSTPARQMSIEAFGLSL